MSQIVRYRNDEGYITENKNGLFTTEEVRDALQDNGQYSVNFRLVGCPFTGSLRSIKLCRTCQFHGEEDYENACFTCNSEKVIELHPELNKVNPKLLKQRDYKRK